MSISTITSFRFAAIATLLLSSSASAQEVASQPTSKFLNSLGVVSSFSNRGQPIDRTETMIRYGGFRWVRAGIEDFTNIGNGGLKPLLDLHSSTGVKFSWGLLSGNADIEKLLDGARLLAAEGALLAIEGNNEPNNWPVTYRGKIGGGHNASWLPVANLQADLYEKVKTDKKLSIYPVWTVSEPGAERDNVGLQFLTIPHGAKTIMPEGTRYADAANIHNYVYHVNSPNIEDNKVWNAADPSRQSRIDGLYANYGRTWYKKFEGYSDESLASLPRVTTETGVGIGNNGVTEEIQALNLLNLYLSQFKRGYTHTSVYLLRDRTDESGNQAFGFFNTDYSPRLAAIYLHNLTSILGGDDRDERSGALYYKLLNASITTHDLLLRGGDGSFKIVIWNEQISGQVTINLELQKGARVTKVFDPTIGVAPIGGLSISGALNLTLSNHPLVVEIKIGD